MKPVMLSLFDKTGTMAKPWHDAGYECWIVDIDHPASLNTCGITRPGDKVKGKIAPDGPIRVRADLRSPWLPPAEIVGRVKFVSAFPPCTHVSVSGAKWFKGKGLRKLAESVDMFATAAEVCDWLGAPYIIENPKTTMSTYWRKPDHKFNPHFFTRYCTDDNYTKDTWLWTGGGFVMPESEELLCMADPDDRIHKATPGDGRADFRSATPAGFSKAVFFSNSKGHSAANAA